MVYKNRTGIKIKTIRPSDSDFYFTNDGFHLVPRASVEVSCTCPKDYQDMIQECLNHGWIKVVANMKESEYVWEKLGE